MITDEIAQNIQSGFPGIHLKSSEYLRVDSLITEVAEKLEYTIREWTFGSGTVDFKNKRQINPDKINPVPLFRYLLTLEDIEIEQQVIVIKHADLALKKDNISLAKLQQLLLRIQKYHKGNAVVFLCSENNLNYTELKTLVLSIDIPPLSRTDLELRIHDFQKKHNIRISTETKKALLATCSGMEEEIFYRVLTGACKKYKYKFNSKIVDAAIKAKKHFVEQSGVIELISIETNINDVGGLDNLKKYIRKKKRIIERIFDAEKFGISPPKGILLAGMPGCGKSLTAKAIANSFNLPLLRLDIGSLMGKYVGESEANLKKALQVAEQTSPCVLWIDELEKAFSGIGGQGGSAEITTRIFGHFLTWMQEKTKTVFVVATANDVESLPPELLRRGRFDEIFSINFPNKTERKKIFEIHLQKANKKNDDIDLNKIAKKTDGYSGADIESLVNSALEIAFIQGDTLSHSLLESSIDDMTPLKDILADKISKYEKIFSKFKFKFASLSQKELSNLEKCSNDSDPTKREDVAMAEDTPRSILEELSKDADLSVRKAVLTNPHCPQTVLDEVLSNYNGKFDFSKSGTWKEEKTTKEEFQLALTHPNASDKIICDLYKQQKITQENMVEIISARNSTDTFLDFFKTAKVKLPKTIHSGIIKSINIKANDVLKPSQILIELDDNTGSSQKISNGNYIGVVKEISVSIDDRVASEDILIRILIPKQLT